MNDHQPEMPPQSGTSDKTELTHVYDKLGRASRAMVNLIVLRDEEQVRAPNMDLASHEGWLRSEIFRLHQLALDADPNGEYDMRSTGSLGEALTDPYLNRLAQAGRPLTRQRLYDINPSLTRVAEYMEQDSINWPKADNVFHDVLPEDFDDQAFAQRLLQDKQAYNNFPEILATEPAQPKEGEDIVSFMSRTKSFHYATKPYLLRAYALQPAFMGALQERMSDIGSMSEWRASLVRAATQEDSDPEDKILLRASRTAYQLLINLMRKDDLKIQSRLLKTSTQRDITNPEQELWT